MRKLKVLDRVTAMEVENIFTDDAKSQDTITYTFPKENFSKVKDAVLSPPFMISNVPWKIMIMQRTNNVDRSQKSLGFFLQCNGDSESSSWSCYANACLTILSQTEGIENFSRKIQHLFYSKENDWGFSHFIGWNDVMDPEKGYIKNDTLIFQVQVTADTPHGKTLNFPEELNDQGTQCDRNSLSQSLSLTDQTAQVDGHIWQGTLEWQDQSKSGSNSFKQAQCSVSVAKNKKEDEFALKAEHWPPRLSMQLVPKQVISSFGSKHLKNSTSVLFNMSFSESIKSLTQVMSTGYAGFIPFSNTSAPMCDLKVIILLYSPDKNVYLGFIPNDLCGFINRVRTELYKLSSYKTLNPSLQDLVAVFDAVDNERLNYLWVYMNDLKSATEKHDINSMEHLSVIIRAEISAFEKSVVNENTSATQCTIKERLRFAEIELENVERILKLNKNTSTSSPTNACSHSTIRVNWNPVPFYGKENEWCEWWKVFEIVVDKNESIDEETKMKALSECLKGDANNILGDMPRIAENYKRAIIRLQNEYGDAFILSQTYYRQLENLTLACNLQSQREVVDKLQIIVQNLDALRGKLPIDDQRISRNIIKKFPNEVFRHALHSLKSDQNIFDPKPTELLVALERYLQVEKFIATHKMEVDRSEN